MSNYPYDPNGRTPYDPHAQTEPAAGRPFSPGGRPYESGNSLTPPPPPQYSMNPGYTNYPPQSFQRPMSPPFQQPTPPPPGKAKGSAVKRGVIISIVAVLVLAGIVGVFVLVKGPAGGPTVSATPTPIPYPVLASAYAGTVHNSTAGLNGNVSFTSIAQTKGNVSGNISIGLPLLGSGPFSGTISSSGSVHLVDVSNDGSNVKITFTGLLSANKSMSGTYTVNNNQGGSWQTAPAPAPIVYPVLYPKYSGTYKNDTAGTTGKLSLTFTAQNQQTFNGKFTIDGGSTGLAGTVGKDNSIQFNVGLSDAMLTFKGFDTIDGSLSGTYTYMATSASAGKNGNGTWKVSPG